MAAGSIIIEMLMKTGKFETDTGRAQKRLESLKKEAIATAKSLATIATGAAVAGFSLFIKNTMAAEKAQAQLAAVLESTGQAAGQSAESLNAMALEMSRATTYSTDAINNAQTRLLSYTGVVGEQFPKAMQAVVDMSARMGMSLEQSAETIGRALDIPSQGLTALTRQGFRFTDAQKELVKQLEETGKTAEAQEIILSALESSYGGAAEAARNTFGGAMVALKNEINLLTTGDEGSMDALKDAVNGVIDVLRSDAVKSAFAGFTTGLGYLAKMATAVGVVVVTAFTHAGRTIGAIGAAIMAAASGNFSQAIDIVRMRGVDMVSEMRAAIENVNKVFESSTKTPSVTAPSTAGMDAMTAAIKNNSKAAKQAKDDSNSLAAEMANANKQLLDAAVALNAKEKTRIEQLEDMLAAYSLVNPEIAEFVRLSIEQAKESERVAKAEEARAAAVEAAEEVRAEKFRIMVKKQIDDQERLNSILAKTPTGKAKAMAEGMQFLHDQFMGMKDKFPNLEEWTSAYREAAQTLVGQTQETTDAISEFWKAAAQSMQGAMSDFFFDIMQGKFSDMVGGFKKAIDRMVADLLASQLLDFLKKTAEGGGFGSFIAGIFGGARAGGGDVIAGRSYLVGERGPEMFTPRMAGSIAPAAAVSGGSRQVVVSNNFTINGPTDRRSQQQISAEVGAAVDRAMRRNR